MDRVDIKAILRDPKKRRELLVRAIYSTQAMEDPTMTMERAEAAYDAAQAMKLRCNRCHRPMKGTTAYDGACECGGLIERMP